jgi:predicted peptidase
MSRCSNETSTKLVCWGAPTDKAGTSGHQILAAQNDIRGRVVWRGSDNQEQHYYFYITRSWAPNGEYYPVVIVTDPTEDFRSEWEK